MADAPDTLSLLMMQINLLGQELHHTNSRITTLRAILNTSALQSSSAFESLSTGLRKLEAEIAAINTTLERNQ